MPPDVQCLDSDRSVPNVNQSAPPRTRASLIGIASNIRDSIAGLKKGRTATNSMYAPPQSLQLVPRKTNRLSKAMSQKCIGEGSNTAGTFYNMARRLSQWNKHPNFEIMELTAQDETNSSGSDALSVRVEKDMGEQTPILQEKLWSKLIIKGNLP